MVSSISQKEQSIKLTQEGFEVFREYYPMNEQVVVLDCVWKTDKFLLQKKFSSSETDRREKNAREVSIGPSAIQYQSIEVLLGDDESHKADPNSVSEGLAHTEVDNPCSLEGPSIENDAMKKVEDSSKVEDVSAYAEPPNENLHSETGLLVELGSSLHTNPLKRKSGSRNKVAFVSVKKPAASTANISGLQIKGTESHGNNKKRSIFKSTYWGKLEG